jgi:cytochrome c oxidase subunit 4
MESPVHKVEKIWIYLIIYVLLILLLVGTVAASGFDLGDANIVISLLIAVIKALLVILFFMHVRRSSRLTWVFAAAAFLWLSLLLGLTMTDYAGRGAVPAASKGVVANSPEQQHLLDGGSVP